MCVGGGGGLSTVSWAYIMLGVGQSKIIVVALPDTPSVQSEVHLYGEYEEVCTATTVEKNSGFTLPAVV